MDKTLGQIACEACTPEYKWAHMSPKSRDLWDSVAAAIRASIKEVK